MRRFEPVWVPDPDFPHGYRWHKRNYPIAECFQIAEQGTEAPAVMCSIILPEHYMDTTLFEEARRYPSRYNLSIAVWNLQLWLMFSVSVEYLQDSIMGFINQARSEAMNIVDLAINKPDKNSPHRRPTSEATDHPLPFHSESHPTRSDY